MKYFIVILLCLFSFPVLAEHTKLDSCKVMLAKPKKPRDLEDKWHESEYAEHYFKCWAEAKLAKATRAKKSFIGKDLWSVSNPSLLSASSFSSSHCKTPNLEYHCWTDINSNKISLADAIRKDAPKLLKSEKINWKNKDIPRLVLCYNDMPDDRSCMGGEYVDFWELGRGDIDHDGIEDIAVQIDFSGNTSNFSMCYAAIMTRKSENSLFIIKNVTPIFRCG